MVLEAVQSLSRDVAGEARREKEDERGCDPALLKEEGRGISRGREGGGSRYERRIVSDERESAD